MTFPGKLIFALLGLFFFGFKGMLIGATIGHILVDRSIIIKILNKKLSQLDDYIRMLLPYKSYLFYDRFVNFIANEPVYQIKTKIELYLNRHLVTIIGIVIGLCVKEHYLLFVLGFIGILIDSHRKKGSFSFRKNLKTSHFWYRINPLKMALYSTEAKNVAFVRAMACLAAKICNLDGQISENEIKRFQQMFNVSPDKNSAVANLFYEAKQTPHDFARYAYQIKLVVKDNLEMQESVAETLFKFAISDGFVSEEKTKIIREIAEIIELPVGNFEAIQKAFEKKSCTASLSDFYNLFDLPCTANTFEIKKRWRELTAKNHPDKIQSEGGTPEQVQIAAIRMSNINNAYRQIMKSRGL